MSRRGGREGGHDRDRVARSQRPQARNDRQRQRVRRPQLRPALRRRAPEETHSVKIRRNK